MTGPAPIVELLLIAVAVAVATKYVRLPYTVALVLVGVTLGALVRVESLQLSRELILFIFLPPLLFEGCLNMDLSLLVRNWRRVFLLAVPGTLASALLIGFGAYHLFSWLGAPLPIELALLLGVMLSPTDPISVLAIFKEQGVTRELSILVEGESVFNDGIGVVLFLLALEVAGGHSVTLADATVEFVREVAGGALVGFSLGYLIYRLLGQIDDHLVEVVISLVLAYGVYLVAERLHMSGVIAVVVSGLIIGNYGRMFSMSPTTRISLAHFWDVASFIINSLLFLLMGLELDLGRARGFGLAIFGAFALMIVARTIVAHGSLWLDRLLGGARLPRGWSTVVNWGGIRGSIPIALALGLPAAGLLTPGLRAQLIAVVFGAVFLSVVVQGLTMKPLLGRLGLLGLGEEERLYEEALGRVVAARAAVRSLESAYREGGLPEERYERMKARLEAERARAASEASRTAREYSLIRRRQLARSSERLVRAERTALDQAYRRGLLSATVADRLKRELDARLVEGSERGWERVWEFDRAEGEEDGETVD
ncbi:MAG: Na+/H+ antiporter [Gemmatimonadota bacterium]